MKRNAASNAAKTPEEARARLQFFERHILQAQVETNFQLIIGAPHERVLSARYVLDHLRETTIAWAEQRHRTFGAGHLAAFLTRMEAVKAEANRITRESRERPEYLKQRELEQRQHALDHARAQEKADAMMALERAQEALAARGVVVVDLLDDSRDGAEEHPEPDPIPRTDGDQDGSSD